MSELISGKEAINRALDGEDVLYRYNNWDENIWRSFNEISWNIRELNGSSISFKLKPKTITINGIEVPACGTDYKPNTYMFVLNSLNPNEYSKIILDESDEVPCYWWRTESEIKQVIDALRQILHK